MSFLLLCPLEVDTIVPVISRRALPILGLSLMLGTPAPVSAADAFQPDLTWDRYLQEARAHHPGLRAAWLEVEIARTHRAAAMKGFWPHVDLSAGRGRSGTAELLLPQLPEYNAQLTVTEPLFAGFGTLNEIAKSSAALREELAKFRAAEAEIRQHLRERFVEVLDQQELVSLREAAASRRQANILLVKRRVDAGKEDQSSLAQAQAEAGKAEFERVRSHRELAKARRRLAREMDAPVLTTLTVTGAWDVQSPPDDPDVDRLIDTVPAVLVAAAEVDQAQAGVAEARVPFFPSLEANAGVSLSGPTWPPADSRSWSTGISLSYNLFNGDRDRLALVVARLEAEKSREDLLVARREAMEALEEALEPFRSAYESVGVRRTSLEAVRARVEDARAKYAAGALGFDQWHELEGELIDAQLEDLQARKEALNAEAGWLKAIGVGFE